MVNLVLKKYILVLNDEPIMVDLKPVVNSLFESLVKPWQGKKFISYYSERLTYLKFAKKLESELKVPLEGEIYIINNEGLILNKGVV